MKFLKIVFASILGFFISLFIILFLFIITVTALVDNVNKLNVADIQSNSLLKLYTHDDISDYSSPIDFKNIEIDIRNKKSLKDYTDAIRFAASDDKIKGILMNTTLPVNGVTKIKAIRDAIKGFKKSGKFVYAYGDVITQKDYYLKSIADSIFLNPVGSLEFKGLSSEILYFKDFENKSGISMNVIRHGKYKSAVEPFLFNKMSEANRQQISSFLNSIWKNIVAEISENRGVSEKTLNIIASTLGARNPKLALRNKIIDKAIYSDDLENLIKRQIGVSDDEDINTIDLDSYTGIISRKMKFNKTTSDKIAIIYAIGEIGNGHYPNVINQKSMIKAFRTAVKNENIKGIVLRVNSPGGDALTSDIIWHEVIEAKKKKPVYVSMGDVAASGGYYISCGANKIFAEKTTITGSIGVFGLLPNVKNFMDKIGVNAEQVTTHKNAQIYSPFEDLSENSEKIIQERIENIYNTFIDRVSEGRGLPFSEVNSIAQGRVWSGEESKEIGLVDEFGGLDTTIQKLSEHLNLKKYSLVSYPKIELDIDDFLNGFMMKLGLIKKAIGSDNYNKIKGLLNLRNKSGIQARLPYEITIE